jgi:hypothetical protein
MSEGRVVADVRLAWCGDAIAVRRFEGGEVARIGDGPRCFAYVPCDAPGGWPVVRVDGVAARVVVPPRGKGRVDRATGAVEELPALVAATLRPGDRAEVTIGDFRLDVTAAYGEVIPAAKRRVIAFAPLAHVAIAALVHGGALGFAARAAASEADDGDRRVSEMASILMRAEDRAHAREPSIQDDSGGYGASADVDDAPGDGKKLGGASAAGDEGKAGSPLAAPKARARFAVRDDATKAQPALANQRTLDDAHSFEFLGVLASHAAAPSNAWSEALLDKGPDPFAARGNMRGADAGAALGTNGLALSGVGEGGGGRAEGVGLGDRGPLGHGAGDPGLGAGGDGTPLRTLSGWGGSWSSGCRGGCGIRLGHISTTIRDPMGAVSNGDGRLPPEIVQAIVRKNFGRFRACYAKGLAGNPTLAGGVKTQFVVEGDRVVAAEDAGSSMPDRDVRDCVVRAFVGIEFPKVTRVSVVYPISFSPE